MGKTAIATAAAAAGASRAYVAVVLGVIAIVVWGFWPSYFGPLLRGGVHRHWFMHLRAAVFVGWLVLVEGIFISIAMPVVHVKAGHMPVGRAAMVVLYDLTDIVSFGGFFLAALLLRRRPDYHQRLILSATMALSAAAVGRVLQSGSLAYLLVWLSPLFAGLALDLWTRHRPHPVSLLSVPIFVGAFFKVEILS
jgi:hypothetical protein